MTHALPLLALAAVAILAPIALWFGYEGLAGYLASRRHEARRGPR